MKNLIIGILAVGCLYLGYLLWSAEKRVESMVPVKQAAEKTVTAEAEIISKNVDQNGIEHAIIDGAKNVIQGPISDAPLDTATKKSLDSALRVIGVKDKQISVYQSVNATLKDSLMMATRTKTGYDYQDKWTRLSLSLPTLTDSASFAFQYNAELNWLEFWKRNWFLSPKQHYIDIWLSDPRATVNSVKRLRIEPKSKQFGIAVMAVGEYYRGDALMGGGVSVDAGRFRLQGSYLHDFSSGEWYPAFRGGFKLIDIN
ncbi:hypothetical protein [Parapedobacter indicus]|uniref:Uncharacterized protein n=1 Tax=Parapedobacter indicus TaxID=1477437 RepID=A0A1I3VTN8_9SPHI|nr:hypothetical protein [Parapedobacter indicus]PPK97843.1 hypothetical protein CLV26_1254 [Parapedobacter indicus]SFJ98595.1 hypothetical protein SAMN05444682_1272 [Parapedobacter indicus]